VLNWDQDPKRAERGIQMLLKRKFPGLRSLDGAGGDGGRDAQLITSDGRTVFEVKSFGRLTSSRRRQAERSLRQAVESAPGMTRWVLVIPMNMTPARPGVRSSEEQWFDEELPKLAAGVDLDWWGLDWLDDQVAQNMDIQRYIEGVDGQLLQRAAEFNMERDVLAGGVEDLRSRISNLQRRVDEISPFWTLDFAVRDGVQMTTLRAKVDDAPVLDPITITPTFTFRTDDADEEALRQQFERTLAFGGSIDLPAGYVTELEIDASDEARLLFRTGDPATSEFSVLTTREQLDPPIRCTYQVLDDADGVLEQFHVFFRERTAGARGVTLFGGDAAGVANFDVAVPRPAQVPGPGETVDIGAAHMNLELPEAVAGYDVDSLLPVLRTLTAAIEGTQIRLQLPGLGNITGGPVEVPPFANLGSLSQVVTDLHRIGEDAGSVLRFPANLTVGEVKELRSVVRQLDGESVEHGGGVTITLRPDAVAEFLATLKRAPESGELGGFWAATESQELKLGDLTLSYGPTAFWAPHPRLVNRAELEEFAAQASTDHQRISEPAPVEARFEPTDVAFRWVSRELALAYFESGDHPSKLDA
jgi:hypothetical protein